MTSNELDFNIFETEYFINFSNVKKKYYNAVILPVDAFAYMYVVYLFFGTISHYMAEIIERWHIGCYLMIALRYK